MLLSRLSEYYTVKSNFDRMTKENLFTMTENPVINFKEIDRMLPSEQNRLKPRATKRYMDERPPYGRNKEFKVREPKLWKPSIPPSTWRDST